MLVAITKPLFAWDCLEDHPSIRSVREFLSCVPDAQLLAALVSYRGRGRDDYPVHVLWGVVLLTIALRHSTFEGCLGELRRNGELRRLIGITRESEVPKKWNLSRFLAVLGTEPFLTMLREIFNGMLRPLGEEIPDFGKDTAGDATHLNARRTRSTLDEHNDELPQAGGGRKEYKDEAGAVVKIVEWFGYKLHLLVDRKHEVALAYQITAPDAGDNELVGALVKQAKGNLPVDRMQTMSYDKAADGQDVHEVLAKEKIKPVIQTRSMWKDEQERILPGADGQGNVVYDEAGTIYCYDKSSRIPVRHQMSFIGYEQARGTLKYRCPARHQGFRCAHEKVCNAGKKYGKTVRVKCEIDLRRFPPIPRATKTFERLYKGRTSTERVNARLKLFWGIDDGNITGAQRFHALVGVVMVVHVGFATLLASTPRREGTLGKMHLSPIAKALQHRRQE